MAKRKNYSPKFKAQVALEAISNEKTMVELSQKHSVHPSVIVKWVKQLKESAEGIFTGEIKSWDAKREKEIHDLHAKIGQLTVERDFLAQAWEKK